MGGAKSAINENTTSIILEVANFDAVLVRKASQLLNLRTDASMRFEKTLDPLLPSLVWQRAWQLIKELMPEAELAGVPTDIVNFKVEPEPINVDFSWLKKKLGKEVSRRDTINILVRLGFGVTVNKNILAVTPPSWRAVKDVTIKEDILEEVARIIGYNNIPALAPIAAMSLLPENHELQLERKIQDILSGAGGLHEVYNYSFASEALLSKLNFDASRHLRLANYQHFGLFEMGRIFLSLPGEYSKDAKGDFLPYQGKRLGLMFAGPDSVAVFSHAKGIVDLLFASLWPQAVLEFTALENAPAWSQANQAAAVYCGGKDLGVIGLVSNKLSSSLGLKLSAVFIELNFQELLSLYTLLPARQYQETSKYPAIVRDLAFVVNEKVLYNDFWRVLADFHPLISRAELFDIYQGGALGEDKKSWAFHITYQASDRTLTAEEVDLIQTDLIQRCHSQFDSQIRDF
jgi:phenylalanyl-tRNA synthetase beta chain